MLFKGATAVKFPDEIDEAGLNVVQSLTENDESKMQQFIHTVMPKNPMMFIVR